MKLKSQRQEENTLAQLEEELKTFVEFCKEHNLSDDDIQTLFKPINDSLKMKQLKNKLFYTIVGMLLLIIIYFFTDFDQISWHFSAIGRIILIKLLPFWNWLPLKNEKCFIPNYYAPKTTIATIFDCAVCESIENIDIVTNIEADLLQSKYFRLDVPVVLSDELKNWPTFRYAKFNLTNAILNDDAIADSLPCKLSSNTNTGGASVKKLLTNIQNFESYFIHFQNCDFNSVKAFRTLSPRPDFLFSEVSPIQYNWLLMSKSYKVGKFKSIDLQEPVTVIGQVKGSNTFRLLPRHNCESECPVVDVSLKVGEALIITSLWNLEYKPKQDSENVAIILEAH